ncbi:Spy/CpxP family protein refolding chaperone [Cypionkella sp.]|uniref:Spy/CpxP family protein refolding chaperone n=1 Tax=Cypionkella sp. TaxID=2811411 RepID=UPI00271FF474|nr:Spy/CpxP family protein refolding chaperone [Cypionkella sp.]MDO8986423.1 Spy/CpxP family protein refolding chaperone [Cypionkella sp.]MDP2048236.1 Spy/CpxP family protein refolding chaperone [Cypionkella sp.]
MPRTIKTLSLATLALAAFSFGAVAQTTDEHHPAEGEDQPAAAQPADQIPSDQMGSMMQGMMAQMPMMQMMKAMQGQDAMGGLDLTERVEGRIAFLKAELAITDAQADKWSVFADSLRAYSAALKPAQMAGMDAMALDLVARLDQSEKQLSAELDGLRGLKAALAPLWDALTDEQRSTATMLLPVHMGFGMAGQQMPGMGAMGGAMMPPAP